MGLIVRCICVSYLPSPCPCTVAIYPTCKENPYVKWRATAEEVKDASETLPRAILWGVALNAILGYITVLTLCFTITDPETLLNSPTGYPFIQLFYSVTNSYAGADIMVALVIITLVSAVISEIATASRQIWSFARDHGLPFSSWLAKVG